MEFNEAFLEELRETYPDWFFKYWIKNPQLVAKRTLTRHGTRSYNEASVTLSYNLEKLGEDFDLRSDLALNIKKKEESYPSDRRIVTEYCHEWGVIDVYDFSPSHVDNVLLGYMINNNIEEHFNGLKTWKPPKEVNITIDENWPDGMKREAENTLKCYQRELADYNNTQELLKEYDEACAGDTVSAASIIFRGDVKNWYPYLSIEVDYLK